MESSRVSVVIPAYRATSTICRAIDSVVSQTSPVFEIIVVDDESPDDIQAAIRKYGTAVKYFRQSNGGAASARNFGIDHCSGDIVAFLDADDYWEPEKIARQLDVFERFPDVGLVGTCSFSQTPDGPRVPILQSNITFEQPVQCRGESAVIHAFALSTITVAVRRSALGQSRFDTTLRTAEDRDLWIRLVASTPLYFIADRLATCVWEPGSLSRANVAADYENMLRVLRRYRPLLGARGLRRWIARSYRKAAGVHLSQRNYRGAIFAAFQSLLRNPLSVSAWWILLKSSASFMFYQDRTACERPRPDVAIVRTHSRLGR
jgi:glycosyltransferase involved in cell wall biosynthesis